MSGLLSIVGTPIGNLEDLSPRAAKAFADADIVACEDTRVTRTLLSRVPGGVRARLLAYHARNESERTAELVHAIAAGSHVVLATDAGMPGLSDPGQRLVAACAEAGVRMEVIPGPSAVPAALIVSGLPTARFVFEGFLPRSGSTRRKRIESLAAEERTIVLFEAPHRIERTLRDLAAVFGERRAALARELTKIHEEVLRGDLADLADQIAAQGARGEMTVVIEGAPRAPAEADPAELADEVAARIEAGETKKDAIAAVASARAISKKIVYQAVLDATDG